MIPTILQAYLMISSLYAELRDFERAVDTLHQLLEKQPKNLMGLYYLARIYAEIKLYDQSLKYYQEVLDLNPQFEAALMDMGVGL